MLNELAVSRNEYRFLLLAESAANFLAEITAFMDQLAYDLPVSRTVYLNSDNYTVPWGVSLRLRKYLDHYSQPVRIDPDEVYRLEIKTAADNHRREKIQKDLPLGKAIAFAQEVLGNQLCEPLRPYTVVEYRRLHFVPKSGEELRLTVDQDIRYGFFSFAGPPGESTSIGKEDFVRLELKLSPDRKGSIGHQRLLKLLARYRCLPVISKREAANSLVGLYIDRFGADFKKELVRCEIETKFLVDHPNPASLLIELKRYLAQGDLYYLPDHYPYIQQGASINHYWSCRDIEGDLQDGMKLQAYGGLLRPVFKRRTEIRPAGGLPVVVRWEHKDQPFPYTPGNYDHLIEEVGRRLVDLSYQGYVYRLRRAFWPENRATGRIYHISIDEVSGVDGRKLFQLEVEYTGRHLGSYQLLERQRAEAEIVDEVGELSAIVLGFCNRNRTQLTPTTLTKFEWLAAGGKVKS